LNPAGASYANLLASYLYLDRLDEAKNVAHQAYAHGFDPDFLHLDLYLLDFLQHDSAGMEQEAAGLIGKAGYEDLVLSWKSEAAAANLRKRGS
jgi:hypothetical protein